MKSWCIASYIWVKWSAITQSTSSQSPKIVETPGRWLFCHSHDSLQKQMLSCIRQSTHSEKPIHNQSFTIHQSSLRMLAEIISRISFIWCLEKSIAEDTHRPYLLRSCRWNRMSNHRQLVFINPKYRTVCIQPNSPNVDKTGLWNHLQFDQMVGCYLSPSTLWYQTRTIKSQKHHVCSTHLSARTDDCTFPLPGSAFHSG